MAVVTTPVGAMNDFIQNGHNGIILDLDDLKGEVIRELKWLESHRAVLATMQVKAYHTVQHRWTWRHLVPQWEAFFNLCLKVRP